MERSFAADLAEQAGDRVLIRGWLQHQRRLSDLTFAIVRDRTGLAQVVIEDPATLAEVSELGPETVVEVVGTAVASEQAPAGVEVTEPAFRVLATPAALPPIDLRRPRLKEQLPTLLDHAPVALRHVGRRAAFAIAAASMAGFRTALDEQGFTEIQTPKIVATATESGANVFRLDYFGRAAYLAQSPQFYKQTMVGVFERVYEVGPVFRAEPHHTARHLAEYVSLDAELGFIDDHFAVMRVLRDAVAGMAEAVKRCAAMEVRLLEVELPRVPQTIPHVHFRDAVAMISDATGEDVRSEVDLAPAHERWLGEWALREHGSDFLYVVGYPMAKRPFYTHPDPGDARHSNSFDLIFRGMELVTGGQRLHRYGDYLAALAAREEDPAAYETYLEAFRYGMPPHGGFAIGLERWVARLTRAENIRETTLFPRDLTRLSP